MLKWHCSRRYGSGAREKRNIFYLISSDFIYAVIVEEYGRVGGLFIICLYLMFLVRVLRIASKSDDDFVILITIGLGFSIVSVFFINMAVAVNLLPVTGQTYL